MEQPTLFALVLASIRRGRLEELTDEQVYEHINSLDNASLLKLISDAVEDFDT